MRKLLEKWSPFEDLTSDTPYNGVRGSVLVIGSGIGYACVKDALRVLGCKAKVFKVSTPVPLPRKLVKKGFGRR